MPPAADVNVGSLDAYKLVKTKGPQEVLTILHAEQPTAN
jgi:hypothetical protein